MNNLKEELKGKSGIYVLRNLVNNKAYIGSAVNLYHRRNQHFQTDGINIRHNRYLSRSFAKHGRDSFIFEVLCYVEDKEQLTTIETHYIQLFETYKPNIGYNISSTGKSSLGFQISEETRQKMSIAQKGKIISNETRQKMSLTKKGKIFSDAHKQNMSKVRKGKPLSKQCIQKSIEKHKIPVIQLTKDDKFIAEYESMKEASLQTNIDVSGITNVCRNRPRYNTAGGFKWMYSSDYYEKK